MDLKLMQAEPSADERAAVDELLGPPTSAWDGALERSEFDHRVARGGAEAAETATCCCPRCTPCRARPAGSARAA